MLFWSLVALFFIAAFLYHSKRGRPVENLPPAIHSKIALVGGLRLLFSTNVETAILNIGKKQGPITRLNLGLHQIIFINGASAIKEAGRLTSLSGFPDVLFLKIMKERGMVTPDDSKELRKFYLKNVKEFDFYGKTTEDKIQAEVTEFLDRVRAHGSQVFDVKRSFNIHTINTMFGILFELRMEQDDQKLQELLKMIEMYMDFPSSIGRICFLLPRLGDWVPSYFSGKYMIEKFVLSFVSVVERNMEVFLQSRIPNQPRNYTDALMDKVDDTSDESSVFHSSQKTWVPFLIDVLLAAVETTSATLEWAVLFLSQFPDVQRKLQDEIDEVIGNGRYPTISDRDKMPYFQAVLEEVFRLAPALPFAFHKCVKDTKLRGYDIKQDSLIFLNFHGTHMDPEIWEEPEIFNPERFLDVNGKFVKSELFTFGSGRRSCLGELVVRVKMFIFLTRILQKFNILPEKKLGNLRGKTVQGYHCVECKVIFEPRQRVN